MIKEMKTLKKFDLNNLDKSKWKSFPFEKIAFRIAEIVDPNTTELEIYYGLEHLDAESLHIRRNGVPSDVSGGKLKCYPGDIIFGKRRAYQRKAGIVPKAGICSAHSFVFRANEKIIDARLFPFFLHSDQFMHKMVDISVGGLSPTINWSDLKHQEFLLPPKEKQAELADLLWAMDEVIEKDLEVLESLEGYEVAKINNVIKNSEWIKFSQVLKEKPQYGANESAIDFDNTLPRYIRITDINDNGSLIDDDKKSVVSNYAQYGLSNNDVLIARTGNTVGKTFIYKDIYRECIYAGYLIRFKINEAVYNPDFLALFFKTEYYKNFIKSSVKIGAQPNINAEQYSNMLVPNVDIDFQNSILESKIYISKSINQIKSKLQTSKALQKALINKVF